MADYISTTHLRLHSLQTYVQPTLLHTLAPTYIPTLQTQPYKPTQTFTLPTYQSYKRPYKPTLHYIPTNPYMPTLPLHTYKHYIPTNPYKPHTLHCKPAMPLRTCSMSMRVDGACFASNRIYVLRHRFATFLHLNLINLFSAS